MAKDDLDNALSNADFKPKATREFVRCWMSLRNGALVPRRQDFDPAQVPNLLPHISIHEFAIPGQITLRLVGTTMVDRYGQKITGRNYLEFIPERRREKTYELLSHIITQPCAMLVRIRTATNVDQQIEFNETVGLPFFNKNGELNLVMYYTVNEDYDRLETDPNQRVMEHLPTERIYFDIGAGVPEWEDEPYPIGEGN